MVCPDPSDAVGTCVNLCNDDGDCSGGQMCCSNGCGQACLDPILSCAVSIVHLMYCVLPVDGIGSLLYTSNL